MVDHNQLSWMAVALVLAGGLSVPLALVFLALSLARGHPAAGVRRGLRHQPDLIALPEGLAYGARGRSAEAPPTSENPV